MAPKSKNSWKILLAAVACLVAILMVPSIMPVKDEAPIRTKLNDLGALATLDGNGRQISAVNLSVMQDKSRFEEAFEMILGLNGITSLNLDGMPLNEGHLQKIGNLNTLASLSLCDCSIGSKRLESIVGLKRLVTLYLRNTEVDDTDLENIALFKNLTALNLAGSKIKSDLSPLASLPKLNLLVLSEVKLENKALASLGNAPSLSRLTLSGTEYVAEDLEALKLAIPTLVIDN